MSGFSQHENCWIEMKGERYGPVTCEIEEHISSPGIQQKYGWGGTLTFNPGARTMPFGFLNEDELVLILDDGRRGYISLGGFHIASGRGNGNNISFVGQSMLSSE